jgi:hypothetical protein
LYINDGLGYLLKCTNVSTIYVVEKTSEGCNDLAVKYKANDRETNGFLSPPHILTDFTNVVDCKTNDKDF